MAAAVRLSLLLASIGWLAACGAPTSSGTPVSSPVPLDLQVRNSGLPGGYVWLSIAGQPSQSRWHRFGMATFICVTCPEPFVRSGSGYEISVLDASCAVRGRYRVDGGPLLVEIELGPTFRIVDAPPLGDWMPEDSPPSDPASVPCFPPLAG